MPASEANENLGKTLISAAVLDYPAATLVNWGKTFENPDLIFGGSHIAKIEGVLDHLNTLEPRYDDDLVILVDGYDVWFQLRPQVLVERYFDINRKADERIRKQLGKGMAINKISQKIVFSAQKRCWPKGPEHAACYAVPESTLAKDVYGSDTDMEVDDEKNPYLKFRQRYLNSGSSVGSVGALRALFKRALDKATQDKGFGSDQGIFAEIFGEQEFQRHCIAQRHHSGLRKTTDWISKMFGIQTSPIDPDPTGFRQLMDCAEDSPFEFGLGLDYEMLISQPTVFSEYDTDWLRRDDHEGIVQASLAQGIATPRVQSLAHDIESSPAPFHTLQGSHLPSGDLPSDMSWNQVPLFTNLWSGISPAAIHHNAHRDGLKGRIQQHWNKTWFQPFARPMLDAHVLEPAQPITVATPVTNVTRTMWGAMTWSIENERGGVTTDQKPPEFLPYEELCRGWENELFRDGKGPWRDSRFA